jgi:ribose-phosphate pyrophosphokinase
MAGHRNISLFALGASKAYGTRVSRHLEIPLAAHEEREFEDGEHKARPLASVQGHDAFVIHSLHGEPGQSVNDKLCRLLFFIGALKDNGAHRVTAIVPYLCYARKDRRTKPHDPVTTRYLAEMFEAVGVDRVITIDVHNLAAFQNAFRCPTDHLEATSLFADHFGPLLQGQAVAVASPDIGGAKRAEQFRRDLAAMLRDEPAAAFVDKRRSGGVVSGDALVGDVRGRAVIILDALISTGTTIQRAARACREAGASRVYAAATHGLFHERANEIVLDPVLDGVVVTDTVPAFRLPSETVRTRLTLLDSSRLVAEAINANRADG